MALNLGSRVKHAFNAFMNRDPTYQYNQGVSYSSRPDRPRLSHGSDRTIITSIINRIAIDAASVDIKHCRLDKNGRFVEEIASGLNDCLKTEANIDQSGRAFRQDVFTSILDEGCIAVVPIDTTDNPAVTDSYDILSMRTGKILEWFPNSVKVRVYNDRTGEKEDIILAKNRVSIIENPLYAIMNERNSIFQRLMRKLSLLDATDEQTASGKLDLIIQVPYSLKSPLRKEQAEGRRQEIQEQLAESKYGIAYIDSTEKVVQLNRSLENNLMKQIEYFTDMVYSQLGITQEIMNGTADEQAMLNYNNRTIEPLVSAFVDAMNRTFLTKTSRTQGQSISYFRDPFKLVPINNIAEIADKFTRNEILTSNEIRQIIGMKPSEDPKADELRNSNISQSKQEAANGYDGDYQYKEEGEGNQNG